MRVVCVGVATRDTIALVERYPAADERIEALTMLEAGGGPAATAAVTLARLGVDVAFAGAVGDDEAGRRIRAELAAEGVDVGLVERRHGAQSAGSVVIVDRGGGSRAIVNRPPPPASPSLAARVAGACREADWVHVDHCGYPVLAALAGRRPLTSLDAGNPVPSLSLVGLDLYAPTESQLLARYPGRGLVDAMRAAWADGARLVVVSRGKRGSAACGEQGEVFAPAFATDVVSTLGAGDVFHGALVAQLAGGRELGDALRWANAAAALSCRALDGRSAIPRREELATVMQSAASR